MKKRTLKKIALTKETLRSLNDQDMMDAAGGVTTGGGPNTCNASCVTDGATRLCTNCDASLCIC